MKQLLICLILLISIFTVSCNDNSDEDTSDQYEDTAGQTLIEENKEHIEDEALDHFIESHYQLNDLISYEFFRYNDAMHAVYDFDENVDRNDILKSKDMTWEVFVIRKGFKFGPYPEELYSQEVWSEVNHRILIGDEIIIDETMEINDDMIQVVNYYENTNVILNSRLHENRILLDFKSKIIREDRWNVENIIFEKSFNGYVVFVKLEGMEKMKDSDITDLKKLIEENLAINLAEKSTEMFGTNVDYLGIVLQLYDNNEKYFEETYYNGDNTYWFSEYWGNYNYFRPD